MNKEKEMTELLKAFQMGDVDAFKKILPDVDLSAINVTGLLYPLFDSEKYFEQKEMMNMIKEVQ